MTPGAPKKSDRPVLRSWLIRGTVAVMGCAALFAGYRGLAAWIAGNLHVRAGLATLHVRPLPNGLPSALPDLLRGKLDLDVTGYVRNDNLIDVELRDARWQAWINDKPVGEGELGQVTRLLADREEAVTVQARVDAMALGRTPLDVWRQGRLDLRVVVTVTAVVLGLATSQVFTFRGFDVRLDLPLLGQAAQSIQARPGDVR